MWLYGSCAVHHTEAGIHALRAHRSDRLCASNVLMEIPRSANPSALLFSYGGRTVIHPLRRHACRSTGDRTCREGQVGCHSVLTHKYQLSGWTIVIPDNAGYIDHRDMEDRVQPYLKMLTWGIAAFAVMAAGGGLIFPSLYRDIPLYKAAWLGNDVVTLMLIPVLLWSFHHARKGHHRPYLLWLGVLLYMFYNYAFYLFGATFNRFFVLYAGIFTLSLYALVLGLLHICPRVEGRSNTSPALRRAASVFLLLVAIPLAWVELSEYVRFVLTGKDPEIPVLILALDLTLVVPNTVMAAILIWRAHSWGVILTAMMLVKSFSYGAVLIIGTVRIATAGLAPWDPLLPFYIFVCAGGLFFLLWMMKARDW